MAYNQYITYGISFITIAVAATAFAYLYLAARVVKIHESFRQIRILSGCEMGSMMDSVVHYDSIVKQPGIKHLGVELRLANAFCQSLSSEEHANDALHVAIHRYYSEILAEENLKHED